MPEGAKGNNIMFTVTVTNKKTGEESVFTGENKKHVCMEAAYFVGELNYNQDPDYITERLIEDDEFSDSEIWKIAVSA